MYYSSYYDSPVGEIFIAANEDKITGLWFVGEKYFGSTIDMAMTEEKTTAVIKKACGWLDRYFAGEAPDIREIPLAPSGSDFRRIVWSVLTEIPYGHIMTYGEVAEKTAAIMGRKSMSSQAVGGAVGHNPISVIIPCHRVIGRGGNLTGYAGGIDKKKKLLELEGVDTSLMFIPGKGTAL